MTRKDRATGSYRGHFMQEIELEYADRRRVGPMKKFFRDCLKEHVEEYIRKLEQVTKPTPSSATNPAVCRREREGK